jgi:hypothetical protein
MKRFLERIREDRKFAIEIAFTVIMCVIALSFVYWRFNACLQLQGATTMYCILDAGS